MAVFFKGKRSLRLVLVSLAVQGLSIWNIACSTLTFPWKTQDQLDSQKAKSEILLSTLPTVLQEGNEKFIISLLEMSPGNSFDFFILKKNGNVLKDSLNIEGPELKSIKEDVFSQEIKASQQIFYARKKTIGVYELILGYFPANNTLWRLLELLKINAQNFLLLFVGILLFKKSKI